MGPHRERYRGCRQRAARGIDSRVGIGMPPQNATMVSNSGFPCGTHPVNASIAAGKHLTKPGQERRPAAVEHSSSNPWPQDHGAVAKVDGIFRARVADFGLARRLALGEGFGEACPLLTAVEQLTVVFDLALPCHVGCLRLTAISL